MCVRLHGQCCVGTIVVTLLFWERFFTGKLVQTTPLKPVKQQGCRVANSLLCGFIYLCLIHCLVGQILLQPFGSYTL